MAKLIEKHEKMMQVEAKQPKIDSFFAPKKRKIDKFTTLQDNSNDEKQSDYFDADLDDLLNFGNYSKYFPVKSKIVETSKEIRTTTKTPDIEEKVNEKSTTKFFRPFSTSTIGTGRKFLQNTKFQQYFWTLLSSIK